MLESIKRAELRPEASLQQQLSHRQQLLSSKKENKMAAYYNANDNHCCSNNLGNTIDLCCLCVSCASGLHYCSKRAGELLEVAGDRYDQQRRTTRDAKKLQSRKKEAMKRFKEQIDTGLVPLSDDSIVDNESPPLAPSPFANYDDHTYMEMAPRLDDSFDYASISTVQQCYNDAQRNMAMRSSSPVTQQPERRFVMPVPEVRRRKPGHARKVKVPSGDMYPLPRQVELDSASEYSLNTQFYDCGTVPPLTTHEMLRSPSVSSYPDSLMSGMERLNI